MRMRITLLLTTLALALTTGAILPLAAAREPAIAHARGPSIVGPDAWLGSLQGIVYQDLNLNQIYDPGEPGLPEAVVILSDSDEHQLDSRRTGADGRYRFDNLEPATYCLRAVNPPGYQPTTSTELCVPLGASDINFGYRRAPSPTPTTGPTSTPTFTPTFGPSPTPSVTPTPAPGTSTSTPSSTPSNTATPSRTPTVTRTPTQTVTPGPSPTLTATPISWIDVSRAMPASCKAVFEGDTTGKPNNASYYGNLTWPEDGPEDVYILHKTVMSDLSITLDIWGGDLDVFLLYNPYPSALLGWNDKTIFYPNLAPGTYYIVVDGFNHAMGPYRLTVFCEGEPTPAPTATPSPSPTLSPTPTNTAGYTYYPLLLRMPTPTPTNTPTPTITPTPIPYERAVDCGSAEGYQASDGAWYAPDQHYAPGGWGWDGDADLILTTPADIADTNDDTLYRTQREAMAAYRFSVPVGRYEVLLRFAEIFTYIREDRRVFDVTIEGQRVLEGLDIYARVRRNRALDLSFTVNVVDGVLDVTFTQMGDEFSAAVNAMRVRRVGNAD